MSGGYRRSRALPRSECGVKSHGIPEAGASLTIAGSFGPVSTDDLSLTRYVYNVVLGTGGTQDLGVPGIVDAVPIGTGGSSRVYRALQGQLGRVVAVKVLIGTAPAERKQFDRESKALGQLSSHPGILSVHDAGFTAGGDPYLMLEYCSGGSLSERLSDGVLAWPEAVAYLATVAETLAHAHERGLVHRDLKPGNILIDDQGRPVIADFGLARLIDAEASGGNASLAAFTPGYVPPETISGEPATTASDVYSLGGTLYSLLTGQVPFVDTESAMNIVALARRVAEEPVTDLRPMGIPDDVCTIIETCMSKDPTERPAALQLSQQLRALLTPPADASSVGTDAATGNNTIHLSPAELARPVETVAPELLGSHTIAPDMPVETPVAAAPVQAASRGSKRAAKRAQKQQQKAAAGQAATTPAVPSAQHGAVAHAHVTGQPATQPPRLARTKALIAGILVGVAVLAVMIGAIIGYLVWQGEDLPSISFGESDESSIVWDGP